MSAVDAGLLHDAPALTGADRSGLLPAAATAGAQVRSAASTFDALPSAATLADLGRPRALVLVGVHAAVELRLLTAVVGAEAVAPLVAAQSLPGWVGPLDAVLVLASEPDDIQAATAADTARRRGARVLVRGSDTGPVSTAAGPDLVVPGIAVPEALAGAGRATVTLAFAAACGLIRRPDFAAAADVLDAIALACHPSSEFFVNPALTLADRLAEGIPVLIGADPLADAVAAHGGAAFTEIARGAIVLDSEMATRSPALLRRAVAIRDMFADPDPEGDTAALRPVLVSAPEFTHSEHLRAATRNLTAALPGVPSLSTTDLAGPAGSSADPSVQRHAQTAAGDVAGAADPFSAALALRAICDFAAVYLGILAGQLPPADGQDGLGRTGTSRRQVRAATVEDVWNEQESDPWN